MLRAVNWTVRVAAVVGVAAYVSASRPGYPAVKITAVIGVLSAGCYGGVTAGWIIAALPVAAAPATRRKLPDKLPDGLTQRAAGILSVLARGMTNPDIAAEFLLSAHRVKSHINRIFAKTGSADRATAISYAHEHDLA